MSEKNIKILTFYYWLSNKIQVTFKKKQVTKKIDGMFYNKIDTSKTLLYETKINRGKNKKPVCIICYVIVKQLG